MLSDELGAGLSLPCKAHLVVRAMLFWRCSFAAAAGRAADVVLRGKASWAQFTECDQVPLELLDLPLDLSFRFVDH